MFLILIPRAGEDAELLELLDVTGENEKWYSHFGKTLTVFYKGGHICAILYRDLTSRYLPSKMKTTVDRKTYLIHI